PERFGSGDPDMPESFVGQLFYPFRWSGAGSLSVYGAGTMLGVCCLGLVGLGGLFTFARTQAQLADGATEQQAPDAPRYTVVTEGAVLATAVSGDGRFVVSAGMDGSVKLHELGAGRSLALPGHVRSVKAVAVSGDGGRVVSGGFDRVVRLSDARTQQELWS